jgi:hypothetical protein
MKTRSQFEEKYCLVDKETGEVHAVEDKIEEYVGLNASKQNKGFEITYPDMMCKYLNAAESPRTKVLSYLIKIKNGSNMISATQKEIIKNTGASSNTVAFVMKKLQDLDLIKRIGHGRYLMNPEVSVRGGGTRWMAKDAWNKVLKK